MPSGSVLSPDLPLIDVVFSYECGSAALEVCGTSKALWPHLCWSAPNGEGYPENAQCRAGAGKRCDWEAQCGAGDSGIRLALRRGSTSKGAGPFSCPQVLPGGWARPDPLRSIAIPPHFLFSPPMAAWGTS